MNVITAQNITKIYGTGESKVTALDDVSLNVAAGEVVLIMGPSGSGKTTLLLVLGTLLHPDSGVVTINEQNVHELSNRDLPGLRLRKIGFIFQHFNLLSALTAQENVMVPLLIAGVKSSQTKKKAGELLKRLGVAKRAGSLPQNLSGGEKQRVAIARAMVGSPSILLADEPTANLDSKTGHEVVEILYKYAKEEGKAVVIVSHDQRIRDIADRVVLIEDGKLKEV